MADDLSGLLVAAAILESLPALGWAAVGWCGCIAFAALLPRY